jgi:hypothetical protein
MRRFTAGSLLLFALLSATPARPARAPASPPRPRVPHVLLVSVDGLRPDVLLLAYTPMLHGLLHSGCYTMWARTVPAAITLPSHTSMLTGVSPAKHGIEWNRTLPLTRPVYPERPTLFELAKAAGYSTAMAAGKAKFATLAKPGTLDHCFVPADSTAHDDVVADTAAAWIRRFRPQVLFVHLADVDLTGHAQGWGSPAQLAAVKRADSCIGRLLAALGPAKDSTVMLVTSDHGGAGKSHGPDDPRSLSIPWIVAGPGIRRDLDLTTLPYDVRTEDTAATLLAVLGIAPPADLDGHAVAPAFVTPPLAGAAR